MPPYPIDPTEPVGNVIAGTFFIVIGGLGAIGGVANLIAGAYVTGTSLLAIGALLLTLSWRGHTNLRQYLDERKRSASNDR